MANTSLPPPPLLGMTQTMCNTTGDVVASLIVARSENLLDDKTYNDL